VEFADRQRLRRIDQATGQTGEPIEPVRPPNIVEVQQLFAEPIGAPETIARYVAKLTVKLCEELELRGLGTRRLDLLFGLVDNRVQAIRVGTAQPVRDMKRLTRLLCDKIETVDPASASRSCGWPRPPPSRSKPSRTSRRWSTSRRRMFRG
jgi:protein ImuB